MPVTKNIDPLDGLRGLAALLVMASHMSHAGFIGGFAGAGQLGVMLFFVLSGFLMGYLYLGDEPLTARQWGAYGIRRLFRVYPVFVLVVVVDWLAFSLSPDWPIRMTTEELVKHLRLQGQLSILWTIPVEMKFYLAFVFIAIPVSAIPRPRIRVFALAGIILSGLMTRDVASKVVMMNYLEVFVLGVLLSEGYKALARGEDGAARTVAGYANGAFALAAVAFVLLMPAATRAFLDLPPVNIWKHPLLPLLATGGIVLAAALSGGAIRWLLANRVSRYLGSVSYVVYLIHIPVVVEVSRRLVASPLEKALVTVAVVLALSTLVHLTVEQPFRRLGGRLARALNPR